MELFRNDVSHIGKYQIEKVLDYEKGIDGLPKSNVLKMFLSNDITVVVRPSGTEPKLKIYFSIPGKSLIENDVVYQELLKSIKVLLK
jgi:phosphoglucomutase